MATFFCSFPCAGIILYPTLFSDLAFESRTFNPLVPTIDIFINLWLRIITRSLKL